MPNNYTVADYAACWWTKKIMCPKPTNFALFSEKKEKKSMLFKSMTAQLNNITLEQFQLFFKALREKILDALEHDEQFIICSDLAPDKNLVEIANETGIPLNVFPLNRIMCVRANSFQTLAMYNQKFKEYTF